MQNNEENFRLDDKGARPAAGVSGWLGKALATAAGIALVGAGIVLSLLAFIAVAALGLLGALYLWWRTRALRRRMREHPPGGRVIEGEATRETSR